MTSLTGGTSYSKLSQRHDRADEEELRIIQQTDVDAKLAKRSAAAAGYLNDPFIADFVEMFNRKSPIINRGTYVRTRSIDRLIKAVLQNNLETTQIVSLGAGTDTRFFNLQTEFASSRKIRYHELDFQSVTTSKVKVISRVPRLRNLLHDDMTQVSISHPLLNTSNEIEEESGTICSPTYNLHAMDIRTLPSETQLSPYLDPKLPTIFLSECCLVYMDAEDTIALLRWITATFQNGAGLILYEPIGGNDAFGKQMIKNLAMRGINLKTLAAYPTVESQCLRLKQCGFTSGQFAIDINFAHDHWMGQAELQRISKLELLDEMEEWRLLASHYCIVWGWKTSENTDGSQGNPFKEWANIKDNHS